MRQSNAERVEEISLRAPSFMERHYTVQELAKLWHISVSKLKKIFKDEPNLATFGEIRLTKGVKQIRQHYRIPESVARRVYERELRASATLEKGEGR